MTNLSSDVGSADHISGSIRLNKAAIDAWRNADPEFLRNAAALGVRPPSDSDTDGVQHLECTRVFVRSDERDEEHHPDYHADGNSALDALDSEIDYIIEEIGPRHEPVIRETLEMLRKPLEQAMTRKVTGMIASIVSILVNCETANLRARVHQLLHAIPRLALVNGFPSMNKSAEACGVSREWIRRGRDSWCESLGIPIPEEGVKKAGASVSSRLKTAAKKLAARNNGCGTTMIHGVATDFARWKERVGGADGVLLMGRKGASDVAEALRPMAELYDKIRRAVVTA